MMITNALSVASWSPTRLDVFALDTNNAMVHKAWDGSAWQPPTWEPQGGTFNSPPAVVAWGFNRLDVFCRDTNNTMRHKSFDGTAWAADWEELGGVIISPPTVVSWGPNRIDIFGLGTDNAMYHKAWDGTSWQPSQTDWEPLGGSFNSQPAAVSWDPDRLDVFALGTDYQIYYKAYNGTEWSGDWEGLGGVFNSLPVAVSWGPGRIDLFGLGTDNSMYHKSLDNQIWSADWEGLGGTFNSPPAACCWGPNRIDLFGLGTDDALYHRAWDGSSWQPSGWEPQQGKFNSAPQVVAWGANRIDIFGLGTDNSMYHKSWNGSAWSDWEGLGGTFNIPNSTVPAAPPPTGLASNWNYLIANNCQNLIDCSVEIRVTEDIVCQSASDGALGFSWQLNALSPQGHTLAFPQYVMLFSGNELSGFIDWWDVNNNKLLGWSQPFYSFPTARIPAGTRLEIFMFTDANGNVFTVRFSAYDSQNNVLGTVSPDLISLPWTPTVAATGLAPVVAFQLNLVGTKNRDNVVLSSGAGTITYGQWGGPLTALAQYPACVATDGYTAETANSVYGVLPSMQNDGFVQTFSVTTP